MGQDNSSGGHPERTECRRPGEGWCHGSPGEDTLTEGARSWFLDLVVDELKVSLLVRSPALLPGRTRSVRGVKPEDTFQQRPGVSMHTFSDILLHACGAGLTFGAV